MNHITNAVKRLERAGSENSRTTEKLHAAVCTVADFICNQVPTNVTLPRGYLVQETITDTGSSRFLYRLTGQKNEWGDDLIGIDTPGMTRAGSLQFAKDVAEGLLDEITEWLDIRSAESNDAAELLSHAC